jgi:hypothetical protein
MTSTEPEITMTRLSLVALVCLFFAGVSTSVEAAEKPAPAPRVQATALVTEQVEVLRGLYARGAGATELAAAVSDFDRRAEPVLARLTEAERADLTREIEQRVAGELWGMRASR